MRTTVIFAALALAAATFPATAQQTDQNDIAALFRSLHWIHGPTTVKVGSVAIFKLPEGYMFLGPEGAKKFEVLTQNLPVENEYILAPEKGAWFSAFHFDAVGYVKDTKTIDADQVLTDVKQGTEAGNEERVSRGWPTMTVVGWRFPPRYDQENKRLEWAIDARDSTGGVVTNYNTRILGRYGVMSVVLVSDPQLLNAAVVDLKSTLNGFDYVPEQTYSAYQEGDKIAEYGLAGLITGGAVAVAAKSGALKWLWKFAWVGIIAIVGALKGLFGRKKSANGV